MTWDEFAQPGRTWRVRARLADRPGTLARLATRLGQHGCNLLGVAVLPVADGPDAFDDAADVVDELVLRAPATLGHGELMRLVEAQGARCLGIVPASVGDLVDAQTAVLRAATDALSGNSTTYEALRVVLNADSVRRPAKATESAAGEVGAVRLQVGGHRATITLAGGEQVVASRGWAPFTDGELARVPALIALLGAAGHRPDLPAAVSSTSSIGVVVRAARPANTAAVTQMHRALMAATVLELRRGGSNRLPRGWAERLVTLAAGTHPCRRCRQGDYGIRAADSVYRRDGSGAAVPARRAGMAMPRSGHGAAVRGVATRPRQRREEAHRAEPAGPGSLAAHRHQCRATHGNPDGVRAAEGHRHRGAAALSACRAQVDSSSRGCRFRWVSLRSNPPDTASPTDARKRRVHLPVSSSRRAPRSARSAAARPAYHPCRSTGRLCLTTVSGNSSANTSSTASDRSRSSGTRAEP